MGKNGRGKHTRVTVLGKWVAGYGVLGWTIGFLELFFLLLGSLTRCRHCLFGLLDFYKDKCGVCGLFPWAGL